MTIRAVLFDVGGPINTEIEHERAIDEDVHSLFAERGIVVTDERYALAWRRAIDWFAWDAYTAVVWDLAHRHDDLTDEIMSEMRARSHARASFQLREGIPELLAELKERGLLLGLAANQPAKAIETLERAGIARYFESMAVSGTQGYYKPDVRLFLDVCERLGVAPEECIMVGDRIDCDVVPARTLGMRTIRIRTGRHASQEPRIPAERPDIEASDVPGMREAILKLLA